MIRHQGANLLVRKGIKTNHREMKREITVGTLVCETLPSFEGRLRFVVRSRADHLDDRGRPAHQRRLSRGIVVVDRIGPHKRQVNVNVGINETGEHHTVCCIDDLCFGRKRRGIDRWLDA